MDDTNPQRTVTTRRRFLQATGVGGAGIVAGCTGSTDSSAETTTTSDSSDDSGAGSGSFATEATVTHWPILMYAPPYQMALEQGYFEEEGIEIESFVGSSGGGTTVRNVVTGGLPFGEVSTPAAVNAYYAGAPLSIIAGSTNSPGTINWVAPPDSEITDISDLAGKTVGFTSPGSVSQNSAALALDAASAVNIEDVELKAMGGLGEGLTAVSEGAIAAAANLDPIFSNQQQDDSWQVVFWAKDYIETFQQTCVIAGPDILEENPDIVRGYLRARERGVEFIRDSPDEAAEIFASYNDGYDPAVMRAAIKNVEPDRYYSTNEFDVDGLKIIEQGMKNIDLIDRSIEWSKLIDQSFLPEDKRVDVSAAEQ